MEKINQNRVETYEHPFYEGVGGDLLTFVAHRGGHGAGKENENTILAIEAAENAGAKFIEIDTVITNDEIPVVYHGTKETRKIIKATDFSDLNTPSTYKKINYKGVRIPALAEPLDYFPGLRTFIDLKSKRAPLAVAKVIKDARAQDRVSIDGEHWKRAAAVLEEIPEIATTIGPHGLATIMFGDSNLPGYRFLFNRYFQSPATSLSLPIKPKDRSTGPIKSTELLEGIAGKVRVTRAKVEFARNLGRHVFLYRVDGEFDVSQAAAFGASGIMADKLELLGHSAVSEISQPPALAEAA